MQGDLRTTDLSESIDFQVFCFPVALETKQWISSEGTERGSVLASTRSHLFEQVAMSTSTVQFWCAESHPRRPNVLKAAMVMC